MKKITAAAFIILVLIGISVVLVVLTKPKHPVPHEERLRSHNLLP